MSRTVWNLAELYGSEDEFFKDFEKSKKLLKNLEKFRNKLNKNDAKLILQFLIADDELDQILEKIYVYANCSKDILGKDEKSNKNYQMVLDYYSQVTEKLAFAKTELATLDTEFLKNLKKNPEFADYDRTIEDIIRYKKHTLSEEKEKTFAKISAFGDTDDLFQILSDIEMDHGSFVDETGKEIKLTTGNYNFYMKSPSQEIRKRVMEAYIGAYGKLNMTLGNMYIAHVKYMNFLAKEYNFKSALDMSTYGEELTPAIMKANIENVSAKVNLLQEYFRVKKKLLNVKKFYTSDISAELDLKNIEKTDFEVAVKDISESLKKLGDDYTNMFKTAIDEGWFDVYPRENKASGGYTTSTYGVHPYILLNYDGTSYWVSAITHEFGHAMHSYYSAKNQPYDKYNYTLFVAEVASLTNEILYYDYKIRKAQDKDEKIKFIVDFMQLFYLNVFNSSMLAEFELFVHETLQTGVTLTTAELNAKYLEICSKYFGKDVNFTQNFEFDWNRRSHFFVDYYLYKYSTGLISACYVAKHILSDDTGEYVKKYRKFLTLGGSKDPISSLKVAGVDILSQETYDGAFSLFEEYLKKLKKLMEEK